MSAIGDYIHLYGWNYADYGINKTNGRPNGGAMSSAAAALNAARASTMKKINDLSINKSIKQLENDLNQFLDWLGTDESKGEVNAEDVRNILGQIVTEGWNEAMNRSINYSSANVTSLSGIGKIKSRQHYVTRNIGYEATLKDRIMNLNQALKELEEDMKTSGEEQEKKAQLEKDMNKVKEYLENDFALVNQYLQETNLRGGKRRAHNEMNMIKELNSMIKTYVPFLDDANQKGHLFEDVIALVGAKIEVLAAKNLNTGIQAALKQVKGDVKISRNYDNDAFFKGMVEKGMVGEDYIEEYNAFIKSVKESSQKVDVSIKYNNKDVNISAKNLNLGSTWGNISRAITLTNGNPLLSLIQDENKETDFVNHYLNLFANHGITESAYSGMFASMRNQYIDVLKLMIMYKAFTGDVYGVKDENKADVFIVNNNAVKKGNHVRVVNIKSVLNKIARSKSDLMQIEPKNIFNERHRYTNTKIGEDDNPWARTGTARIAKLLAEVHGVKIHAMIPAKTIMNLTTMEH